MTRSRLVVNVAIALGLMVGSTRLTGCVGEDAETRPGTLPDGQACALGSESCGCTSGGACDPGLSCLSQRCVRVGEDGAILGDAAEGGASDADIDALSDVREASPEGGTVTLTITMNSAREKPATNSPGTGGPGNLLLDTKSGALKGAIPFANLVSYTTGAHIHQGGCATSGPVVYTVTTPTGVKTGTINVDVILTPADTMAVQKGELYVNLHTEAYPNGEIRGQLLGPSVPDCN